MTGEKPWGVGSVQYIKRPGIGFTGRRPDGIPLRLPGTDAALRLTGIVYDRSVIDFDRLRASDVERARLRFRQSLPDLIWNAAALEGNTFTLPEVRTLLHGVTVGGKPLADEEQVLALSEGYSRLDELVGSGDFSLSKAVSDQAHGMVAVHEAIESGHFRGEGAATGGGTVRLSNGGVVEGMPAAELPVRFSQTVDYIDTLDDPREQALVYFAAATRSQLYFDGNKRTARLMMTGMLMSSGYDAVNIPFARQHEFNVALDELFMTDDGTTLMAFIADCA